MSIELKPRGGDSLAGPQWTWRVKGYHGRIVASGISPYMMTAVRDAWEAMARAEEVARSKQQPRLPGVK